MDSGWLPQLLRKNAREMIWKKKRYASFEAYRYIIKKHDVKPFGLYELLDAFCYQKVDNPNIKPTLKPQVKYFYNRDKYCLTINQ